MVNGLFLHEWLLYPIIALTAAVLLIGGVFPMKANAAFYSAKGNISFYDGEGKKGSDGKIIDVEDCATKQNVDNPKGGTAIYVTN
jgi:hypothetical protein